MNEVLKQAQSDLSRILRDFAGGRFTPQTTLLDVFFAYRLLLSRCPERTSAEFLRDRVTEFPAPYDLARGFLASNEFRDRYFGVSQREDGHVVIARDGDLRIAVDPDDLMIGWAIINGVCELDIRWAIENLLGEGDVCVDVGANVGYFTAVMAQCVGETGRVIAYEPFPRLHRMLAITVEESGFQHRVDTRQVACADVVSEATLFFAPQSDNFGGSFISDQIAAENTSFGTVKVLTSTLDEDLAGQPKTALVKMDIEGCELRALRGMTRRLESDHPILILEINRSCLSREGITADQVLDFLRAYGYAIYMLQPLFGGKTVEVKSKYASYSTSPCEDVLCIEKVQADSVIRRLVATASAGNGRRQ